MIACNSNLADSELDDGNVEDTSVIACSSNLADSELDDCNLEDSNVMIDYHMAVHTRIMVRYMSWVMPVYVTERTCGTYHNLLIPSH